MFAHSVYLKSQAISFGTTPLSVNTAGLALAMALAGYKQRPCFNSTQGTNMNHPMTKLSLSTITEQKQKQGRYLFKT